MPWWPACWTRWACSSRTTCGITSRSFRNNYVPGTELSAVQPQRNYRYYEFVMAAFVTVLICSNLIGPAKIVQFDWLPFAFGAGVLFFPISYVFGDVLTEVYGYARARRVIWAGFGGLLFAAVMASIVVALPPAPFWEHQKAYETAFGQAPRIAAASMF